MEWNSLGDEEITSSKIYMIIFYLLVFTFLFFASIGAPQEQKSVIYYYILFGGFVGLFPLIIDTFVTRKEEPLDTVSIEEPPIPLLSVRNQIILGLLLSLVVGWRIATTGQAFVQGERFSVFEGALGNSILSGILGGVIESMIFFQFLYPTFYSIVFDRTGSAFLSVLVSTVLITAVFTGFHVWRFRYNESALMSVALFSLINCVFVLITRSVILNIMIHFTNNFLVQYLNLTRTMFGIVV
jgi:membrane protease YdiL (CAAX protease family)